MIRKLDGCEFQAFQPWYGPAWTGDVHTNGDWTFKGKYEQNANRVVVTDLGIGIATEKYKSGVLAKLMEDKHVVGMVEAHPSENHVRFELVVSRTFKTEMLKIDSKMSRNCINLMVNGRITHFDTTMQVLEQYYDWRLELYGRRKEAMLRGWGAQLEELTHKRTFIQGVLEDRIPLRRAKKDDVVSAAVALGIPELLVKDKFCSMSLLSLTEERIQQLVTEIAEIQSAVTTMQALSPASLWKADLKKLRPVVQKWIHRAADKPPKKAGGQKRKSGSKKPQAKRAKK